MNKYSVEPKIHEGGFSVDDRGIVSFVNGFNFSDVKRFYAIENFSVDTIRAFHGHRKEKKYIFVISGSIIAAVVAMENEKSPSKENRVFRFILSSRKPAILEVPAGYVNGFRALEGNTKIMIFSSSTLEESKNDDFRFPSDYWGDDIWKVESR